MEFLAKLRIYCQKGTKAGLIYKAHWPGAGGSRRAGIALTSRTQTHGISHDGQSAEDNWVH